MGQDSKVRSAQQARHCYQPQDARREEDDTRRAPYCCRAVFLSCDSAAPRQQEDRPKKAHDAPATFRLPPVPRVQSSPGMRRPQRLRAKYPRRHCQSECRSSKGRRETVPGGAIPSTTAQSHLPSWMDLR